MPSSGPALACAMRLSEALAMSAARSGVSSTKALSVRAFSIAVRCAADNSTAEKVFFFSPSRASAKVSEVSSLTARARPSVVDRLFHCHRRNRCHGLDAINLELGKLLDKRKHRIELVAQMLDFVIGDRNAGEMCDAANGIGVDRHGQPEILRLPCL